MNKRLNLQTTSSTKEVVHIDDSGNSGNKTPVRNKAESRRPTINKPIKSTIQRTVISTPKFSSLQRKLSQTPKAVPGTSNVHIQDTIPTTTMFNPLTPVANSQQPAVSQNNIVKRKTPSRVSLPVPCITKSNERVVPIITEAAPAKVILNPGLTNKSEAANGHLYLSSPQVSHLLPTQISITPLTQAKFIQISSPKIQTPKATPPSQRKYQCSRCKQPSQTPELCDNCQSLSAVSSTSQVPKVSAPSKTEKPVVPKRPIMTKEKFYGNKSSSPSVTPVRGNNYQEHANPRKVFIAADTQGKPRGRPKGSKNRIIEPECLTIESSDEEQEAATRTCQVSSVINTRKQLRNSYNPYQRGVPARLRGTGSRRYCTVKTSTDSSITIENEDNEIIEDEEEGLDDEEDAEDEEDGIDSEHPGNHRIPYNEDCDGKLKSFTLLCRSIRIGSFKIHPLNDLPHLSVLVSPDGFSFRVSKTTQASELVSISLKAGDIAQVLGHFGRCLPIIFIFTTPSCAARIRLRLGMVKGSHLYYDPELADEKQKRITFLIDNINDNMKGFLRNTFPGDGILKEIDQKQANEILVKSTPNQQVGIRNSSSTYQSPPPAPPPQPQPPPPPTVTVPATLLQVQPIVQLSGQPLQSIVQSLQPHVAVTVTLPIQVQRNIPQKDGSSPPKETMKIERPSSPVRKIVTYPPPPEPDNIELNNVDLACLEEGEFLNDKIIDFYLRYLALEMIPEEDRERTHVFNSYFYRGLTQKLQKRASEDRHKTIAEMRHRQVKKWTKNLDIFEKDFIIIPINQNVHWFLAIICYPKLASEGKKSPKNSSASHVKKTEESNSLSNNKPPEVSSGSSISVLINTISPVKTREQTSSTNDRRENNTPDYFEASEDEDDSPSGRLPPDVPNVANAARPAPGSKMPFIILFDSLQTASRQVIGKTLKEYLEWEWKSKKGTTGVFDTASVLHGTVCVPQQTNYSDCGIYVLQYVQSFFEDPFPYIAYPLPDMRNWFDSNKVSNKRKEIKDLIYDLEKRQSPPMASTSSNNKPSSGRMDNNAPSPNSSQSS